MSSQRSTRAVVLAVLVTATLVWAPPVRAQAIISNGPDGVTLGVNREGHLNVLPAPADRVPSPVVGTNVVGIRHNATGFEGLGHTDESLPDSLGGACEGWGVGIADNGVS